MRRCQVRDAGDQVRQRVQVDGVAATGAEQQRSRAQRQQQPPCTGRGHRGDGEGGVREHLGEDASEPHHQHRAEPGVADAADDHLDATRGVHHRLDGHGRRVEVRQHGRVRRPDRVRVAQPEHDSASLGLVQPTHRLEHHRVRQL